MKALITIGATLIILFVFLILVTKKQLRDIRKRVKSSNVSHVDCMKEEEKSYYREILKGYSPAVLSYIDNFEINGKKEVIATLLSLKLKGVINILEHGIEIKDYNTNDLTITEKLVLKNIKGGKVFLKYDELKNKIIEEATNCGLTSEHPLLSEAKVACEKMILFAIVFVLYVFGFLYLKLSHKDTDEFFSVLSVVLVLILVIYYRESKNILSKRMPKYEAFVRKMAKCEFLKRTQKGEDINVKIEGLKKYIKDYSLLSEKNKDALDVWEEYLIYSVLFTEEKSVVENEMLYLVNVK